MEKETYIENPIEEEIVEETSFTGVFSDVVSTLVNIAQENIFARVEETATDMIEQAKVAATEVLQNAILLSIIILLGVIGFVFAVVGISLWLGEISDLGPWFGFLIVGVIIFIIALIAGLVQKNKMSQQ